MLLTETRKLSRTRNSSQPAPGVFTPSRNSQFPAYRSNAAYLPVNPVKDLRVSDFNVPSRCEVSIKRQRFAKPPYSHDLKTHGIDERIHPFAVPA